LSNIARVSGISEERLSDWLVFLLAVHDIGKFSDGFQNQVPELFQKLQQRTTRSAYTDRHDVLGFYFLKSKFPELVLGGSKDIGFDVDTFRDHLKPWFAAVTGHHGRPPKSNNPHGPLLGEQFPESVEKDALVFLAELTDLLLPNGIPFHADQIENDFYRDFPKASWLVAGLAVVSDWMGSNRNWWFPYWKGETIPLSRYWEEKAVPQAQKAVVESGLGSVARTPFVGLRELFNFQTVTNLQMQAEKVEIVDGPQLFIVEEVTGGGKTEAAMVLTHRLMDKGLGDGFFLALPTMATANAMHDRVQSFYRKLFGPDYSPSLVLAHSMARVKLGLEKNVPDAGYRSEGDSPSASQACSAWLSDSRKKALLADVGVGTVDQALLSVLPTRHQSLRLLGLSRKVLVVDEVHACDPYVFRLLCNLLKFHAAWGGTAILLSATLPMGMRAKLLEAFSEGAGWAESSPMKTDYPLLTHLSAEGLCETPFTANERLSRNVQVQWLKEKNDVWNSLEKTLAQGQCACWIRNTVVDAMEAYREAVEKFGKDKVLLFHARFTMGDRLAKEREVTKRFGEKSGREERNGRLVIGTQVVEQSLDLDFDYMVTDLAPIDLILQRAGRLRRHTRNEEGNRMEGSDRRGDVVLGVWMPEATGDAAKNWYSKAFPKAAYVYPHHGLLWLTAKWLQSHEGFSIPRDARDMMEAVYGQNVLEDVSTALVDIEIKAEGNDGGDVSLAGFNALELEMGYSHADVKWDDMNAPTRLGQPTIMVRLARPKGDGWGPWWEGEGNPWENSQLSVRSALVAEEALEDKVVADKLRGTMPDKGKYCVVIPLGGKDDGWVGKALGKDKKTMMVEYDVEFGFRIRKGDDE
jgi:CRISPR-associated endonuclease/helicase Cas3